MFSKHFGGAEGSNSTPNISPDDGFAKDLNKVLGAQIRSDDTIAQMVWTALANRDWAHKDGHTASYSHRGAADLVAAIRAEGNYNDWYHNSPPDVEWGYVDPIISIALETKGWSPIMNNHELGCFPIKHRASI